MSSMLFAVLMVLSGTLSCLLLGAVVFASSRQGPGGRATPLTGRRAVAYRNDRTSVPDGRKP